MNDTILKSEGVFKWYEPSSDDEGSGYVAGTLEITDSGLSMLSLVGLLRNKTSDELTFGSAPIDPARIIVGVLKNSRYVFLRKIRGAGTTFGNLSHQNYRATEALVFEHLDEVPIPDAVTSLLISLDELENWASEPAVSVRKMSRGAAAHAKAPKVQSWKLPDKTVRLRTNIKYTAPPDFSHRSVTIKQETFWEVQPKVPLELHAVRDEFHLLEDLVLFLTDASVVLPWPIVKFGETAARYYFERRKIESQEVEILKVWTALSWPMTGIGTLLSTLKTQRDVLGPGLYLYLGVRRSPALYLENKFSTAIFGLESLHRKVGTSVTQSKLEEKIVRILKDVRLPKDRSWLQQRLRNAGEPSLEERLFLTFSEIDIGLKLKDLRTFSKECADHRNQIAHFGGQRDGGYDEFVRRIFILNEAVGPLYHAVLLNRIGLDRERIWAYFHKSPYSVQRKEKLKAAGLTFVAQSGESK